MITIIITALAMQGKFEILPRDRYKDFLNDATRLHIAEDEQAYALGVAEFARIRHRMPKEQVKK